MVAKTDTLEVAIENKIAGKASTVDGSSGSVTPFLFLATAVTDEEVGTFTEPATADGYARLALTGKFGTADATAGIANAITAQMSTASATWPEIRWGGIAAAGTRGVADAYLLDVLSDGTRSLSWAKASTGVWTAPGHSFSNGDLVSFRVPPGGVAPGGVTCAISKQYKVIGSDQSVGTFQIQNEDTTTVTISSDGSVLATKVVPIPAGTVTANTAVTFPIGTISYAEG